VFVLEYHFASKSSVAVREEFSNACADEEVPNNTTLRGLVIKFRDTDVFVCDKMSCRAEITTVPLSSSASAATTGHGHNNSVLQLLSSLFA
jgi:hypothetical protein